MLINHAIPNLFNGVSQQPAPLRHISQCELMENAFPSIATGLRKRPPTQHIKKLTSTTDDNAFVHLINKDATNRYILLVRSGALEVYDLATGTAQTISSPAGLAYTVATTPRDDLAALTVADYTFLVNKTFTAALTAAVTAGSITSTVQQFSALPAASGVSGNIYRVEGTPDSTFDDYYVKSNGTVYVEHVQPGNTDAIDAATMPWQITKTGGSTFTLAKATWPARLVGDTASNPNPSFIGEKIKDVFFYRNRLGLLAGENVILSRSGEPFTFWAESATAVLDTDPVDVSVSSTQVSVLNSAVAFNKSLMLFSDNSQFQLSSGDLLTPKTGRIDPVTNFQSSSSAKPAAAGNQLFFAVSRGASTSIHEYFVDSSTITNDAADDTAHVPSYVPASVFKIVPCISEDTVLALSLTTRNEVSVYKYYWSAATKVQSSWGKFVFDTADKVLFAEAINNDIYFVIQRADGVHLEKMSLAANAVDADLGFLVHLDRRSSLTGAYDAGNNWTTWTLPYADASTHTVVLGGSFGNSAGTSVITARPSTSTIRCTGDYSAGACYVGRNYTMRFRFSEQYIRDAKDSAITTAKIKMRRMTVNYANTGYFRAEVTPYGRDTYSYEFTGKVVGSSIIGATAILSGSFLFPVMGGNQGLRIDLVNDNYLPSYLQSAEWEGEYTLQSSRM